MLNYVIKAIGGGRGSKIKFLILSLVLKIWVSNFQDLFTEFKNLYPLRFYDVANLVRFSKYIGNIKEIISKIFKILN